MIWFSLFGFHILKCRQHIHFLTNTLRAFIFLELFLVMFSWWVICLFIEGLLFYILCKFLHISSWFNATAAVYWEHLSSHHYHNLLLLCFLFSFIFKQENLYMIHNDQDLSNDVSNKINEHNQWSYHQLSLIFPTQFDI